MNLNIHWLDQSMQQVIRSTGEFIRQEYHKFSFSEVQYKGENDPFSYVDVTAENMLKESCNRLIPGSGFINEESEDQPTENGYTWIIDPLDGTVNFMHGIPHFSISVGLMFEDQMLMGHVYGVISDEMFTGIKGKGAYLNGQRIVKSSLSQLNTSVIVTGFPYAYANWVDDYLKVIADLIKHCHGVRRLGSAALDLCYVAAGRLEAFFEFGLKPYDVAAGSLIVSEAGGQVSDFKGGEDFLFGKQILGSNGAIHNDVLKVLQEHLPMEELTDKAI